jgi:hypothetical protein
MSHRRAVSLIELLLAMSACTVILSMSATLIHRALHAQSKTRAIDDAERAALRLSSQFRRDIHDASAAETDALPAGVFLRLQLPACQTVEYRRAQGSLLRILTNGDTNQARDQFNFPDNIELTVNKDTPSLITLSITSLSPDASPKGPSEHVPRPAPLNLQVAARLNRFAPQAATSQEPAP